MRHAALGVLRALALPFVLALMVLWDLVIEPVYALLGRVRRD